MLFGNSLGNNNNQYQNNHYQNQPQNIVFQFGPSQQLNPYDQQVNQQFQQEQQQPQQNKIQQLNTLTPEIIGYQGQQQNVTLDSFSLTNNVNYNQYNQQNQNNQNW